MSSIEIREAQAGELSVAGEFWNQLNQFHRSRGLRFPLVEDAGSIWARSFERTLGRYSFIWFALMDGDHCGMLAARVKRAPDYLGGVMVGEISDLYVDESARGRGVASELLEFATGQLDSLKLHSIEVQVLTENPEAGHFWMRNGYSEELIQYRRNLKE